MHPPHIARTTLHPRGIYHQGPLLIQSSTFTVLAPDTATGCAALCKNVVFKEIFEG
jgi:hypothetical protein